MANIQALTYPVIHDREALGEFADSLADHAPSIERDMSRLSREPNNRVVVADIFRALHNIKGDAALCRVEVAGLIAHPIESLLTRLRSGEVRYTPLLGEVILLAVDRLELAIEALVAGKPVDHLKLAPLVDGLERMSRAFQADLDPTAAQLIKSVTGFQPQSTLRDSIGKQPVHDVPELPDVPDVPFVPKGSMTPDILFFQSLAMQFETRSPLFKGRTGRIRQLALDANRVAGSPVDAAQLEAAVYMHDVGMMFLPEEVWLNAGNLSEEKRSILRTHPGLGAGLLDRMEGWKEAAEMVRHHHEMLDGAGYPGKLKGNEICPGAKILAIVDAFEAVMLKHSTRGHNRSILRAIAEVNACNNQFAPEWIEPFNTVIRRMVEQ
ncbi:MAG: metal-dependent phosphohydrolase [Gallionellales bacterium GWA2_55_18]|nr:MAG: metal-dependent phosphohydrolase [Gallionellales bacterium GWA2_55_18]